MAFGNRPDDGNRLTSESYPEDSAQATMPQWWIKGASPSRMRGRLLWAFVPYFSQVPFTLVPEGRKTATSHKDGYFVAEPLDVTKPPKIPKTPVAGLTTRGKEIYLVSKAKLRPVLVLSAAREQLPDALRKAAPHWQFAQSLLVAPYFGIDQDGSRAGFNPGLVTKIRQCRYRQYFWDMLPLNEVTESILRLDQIQPIGSSPESFKMTDYCLGKDGLDLMDEWLSWLFEGSIPKDSVLETVVDGIAEVVSGPKVKETCKPDGT